MRRRRHRLLATLIDLDRGAATGCRSRDIRAQWKPHFVGHRERVAFRHHTNNLREAVSDFHGASDDLRIAIEAPGPNILAKYHDGLGARTFVRLIEDAAEQGTLRSDAEGRRGDFRPHLGLRAAVRAHQVDARVAIGA